mmetsp:Transcript_7964/g.12909  ORF Transcript_7964/g.12909 Transcript_7964/m.12909 type:complete len:213 (-) Transcript_7964:739-1377(-)
MSYSSPFRDDVATVPSPLFFHGSTDAATPVRYATCLKEVTTAVVTLFHRRSCSGDKTPYSEGKLFKIQCPGCFSSSISDKDFAFASPLPPPCSAGILPNFTASRTLPLYIASWTDLERETENILLRQSRKSLESKIPVISPVVYSYESIPIAPTGCAVLKGYGFSILEQTPPSPPPPSSANTLFSKILSTTFASTVWQDVVCSSKPLTVTIT